MSFISVSSGAPQAGLQPLYEWEAPPPAPPRPQLRHALYRGRWLVLGLTLAGGLAGGLASWWVRPYYVATGSVIIEHPSLHNAEITPQEYPPAVDADREL